MTEKNYGGSAPFRKEGKALKNTEKGSLTNDKNAKMKKEVIEGEFDRTKILKAGKIASEVRAYAKEIVKRDVLLLDIAEKIEKKIIELGGEPAFPTNLSIND